MDIRTRPLRRHSQQSMDTGTPALPPTPIFHP